jgi:hypothetical protein
MLTLLRKIGWTTKLATIRPTMLLILSQVQMSVGEEDSERARAPEPSRHQIHSRVCASAQATQGSVSSPVSTEGRGKKTSTMAGDTTYDTLT